MRRSAPVAIVLIVTVLCGLLLATALQPGGIVADVTLDNSLWEEAENPVFDPQHKAYYPSVLYDGGTYRMWYATEAGIAHAVSYDGEEWFEKGPVTGLKGGANHPWVTKTGISSSAPKFEIWYWDTTAELYSIESIRHAESSDGINWNLDTAIVQDPFQPLVTQNPGDWNRGSYGPSCVLFDRNITTLDRNDIMNNRYVMYYDATTGGDQSIGVAGSLDGRYWVGRPSGSPVLDRAPSGDGPEYVSRATVFREGWSYRMWFSYGAQRVHEGIGYAQSSDGLQWTEDMENPIFHVSDGVAWRAARTYTPSVLKVGSAYRMWFSGLDSPGGNHTIGYAVLNPIDFRVRTLSATGVTGTSATLNGELTYLRSGLSVAVSFEWGAEPGSYTNETTPQTMSDAGRFSFDLEGLEPGRTYYFRAKADGGELGIRYGSESSFTTVPPMMDNTLWQEHPENPVFDPLHLAAYPSVLYHQDSYKMWYATEAGIAYAVSPDGVSWTEGEGLCGLKAGGDRPWVLRTDTTEETPRYEIWYRDAAADPYSIEAIRHAESGDGIHWVGDGPISQDSLQPLISGRRGWWAGGTVGPSSVLFNPGITTLDRNDIMNNRYVMYYDATSGSDESIGVAGSLDGRYWVGNPRRSPVLAHAPSAEGEEYVSQATILPHDGVYSMWFSYGADGATEGIGYAESNDGLNWREDSNNPIYHITDGKAWRAVRTYAPSVISQGSAYRMWFGGLDSQTNTSIGYAVLPQE